MKSSLPYIPCLDDWEYYSIAIMVVVLVLIGGLVAGLTIGLMSIDSTNLAILKVSGTASEKKAAAAIEPIRKNGHLLLVTLLLVNTVVNETLPILFDALEFHGLASVLCSTALIVVFGEILPQAICSRYGLQIGAFFAQPVRVLIFLLSFLVRYTVVIMPIIQKLHHDLFLCSSSFLRMYLRLGLSDREIAGLSSRTQGRKYLSSCRIKRISRTSWRRSIRTII